MLITSDMVMFLTLCILETKKSLFVAFPRVVTSTGPGGFMVVCVFYDGNFQRHNRKCVFMEKPRIEMRPLCFYNAYAYPLHHGGLYWKI